MQIPDSRVRTFECRKGGNLESLPRTAAIYPSTRPRPLSASAMACAARLLGAIAGRLGHLCNALLVLFVWKMPRAFPGFDAAEA